MLHQPASVVPVPVGCQALRVGNPLELVEVGVGRKNERLVRVKILSYKKAFKTEPPSKVGRTQLDAPGCLL